MTAGFDVYAYGVVAASTLYRIRDPYPAAQGYAEIEAMQHMTGGEATNSAIVLARLGASVRLDGNWLGDDANGQRTKSLLTDFGINTDRLPLRSGYQGVQEMVVADQTTRTIFGGYGQLLANGDWNTPQASDIRASKVVCLDPFFVEPARRVAAVAKRAGVPVVTVDCKHDDPLLSQVAAVVIADSYLQEHYADADLAKLFRSYQAASSGLVIFTFGEQPLWYASADSEVQKYPPCKIEPVDTTGGGDAFRAGIVYGFLRGWNTDDIVAYAAALAAIVCTRSPGVMDAPTADEVAAFITAAGERSAD